MSGIVIVDASPSWKRFPRLTNESESGRCAYTFPFRAVMFVTVKIQYWMSSFPLGKFHASPRSSTSTPRGWGRPAFKFGLPSQYWAQTSSCDAFFLPIKTGA